MSARIRSLQARGDERGGQEVFEVRPHGGRMPSCLHMSRLSVCTGDLEPTQKVWRRLLAGALGWFDASRLRRLLTGDLPTQYGKHLRATETTRAITIDRYGSPDVLRPTSVGRRGPKRNQVLARTRFIDVNRKGRDRPKGKFRIVTGKRFPTILR